MKNEVAINEIKKELEKISEKLNSKILLIAGIGLAISILSIILLVIRAKNIAKLAEDEEFFYDEDDFYEDYHALDYEEE